MQRNPKSGDARKKLTVRRETLRQLQLEELAQVAGGDSEPSEFYQGKTGARRTSFC